MASLADIPDNLINIDKRLDFLRWLRDLATDNMTKKELLFLWADAVDYHVTMHDLEFVFGSGWRANGF